MTTRTYVWGLGVWSVASSAATLIATAATSPQAVGPIGVTVWFVVALTAVATTASLALYGAKRFLKLHATAAGRLRYSWRQGWLIAGWAVGLLALSSLRQLGVRDAILLGLLLVIVEVYVRLRWP